MKQFKSLFAFWAAIITILGGLLLPSLASAAATYRNFSGTLCVPKIPTQASDFKYTKWGIINKSSNTRVVRCSTTRNSAAVVLDNNVDLLYYVDSIFLASYNVANGQVVCTWNDFPWDTVGETNDFISFTTSVAAGDPLPDVVSMTFDPSATTPGLATWDYWVVTCKLPSKTGITSFHIRGE